MASGPDFEVALRAYVEHVYNDLEEISSYGLHSFLRYESVWVPQLRPISRWSKVRS